MSSIMEIMQLCRLCLVKDQVNFPIFEEQGDIRQIFLKITACLPVKVAKDDNLPKKICDGCLYKLELLYQFWNTAANAEKQLLTWLSQAGMDADAKTTHDAVAVAQQSQAHSHSVKQEVVEPCENENKNENSEDLSTEAQNYIIQQQQLPYESVGFPYEEENFNETQESNGGGDEAVSEEQEGPLPKRRRRQCAETVVEPEEAEEDDDDISQEMPVTKTEEESDTEEETRVEDGEPTNFVPIGGSGDNEQPGPSGMGKVASEAPYGRVLRSKTISIKEESSSLKEDVDSNFIKNTAVNTRTWLCRKCRCEFKTRTLLNKHRKETHLREDNDSQYKYTFNKNEDSYTCITCDVEAKTKTEIEEHVKIHDEMYNCSTCSETFYSAYKYSVHMQKHSDDDLYRCPLCAYKTHRITSVLQHINRTHLKKYLYYCTYCGKGFGDVVIFREHENNHLGAKPFLCIVCNKTFAFSRYLLLHQTRYHTVSITGVLNKNQCEVCKKIFSRKNTLEKHIKRHEVQPPKQKIHLCDNCGKGYATKNKLELHYRVHTGYKPYMCTYCEKSFTKKEYLVMHERIHSGEKPYTCPYCSKCFNQDAPLRLHIRGHTGERPYNCHICNEGFISKAALKLHFKNCNG